MLKGLLFISGLFLTIQASAQVNVEKQKKKFGWVDVNKDKKVTMQEMIDFHKDKVNKKGNPLNGKMMFLGLDANDDKKLTIAEFVKPINWARAKKKKAEMKNK